MKGLITVSVVALALSLTPTISLGQTPQQPPMNYCRFTPNRAEALDFPSKHAWDIFLTLIHPAKDMKVARGEPDCSKPVGAPGTTSVWETWRLARTEVFLQDGSEPPVWSDTSLPHAYLGSVPYAERSPHDPQDTKRLRIQLDPEKDQGVFKDHGGIGETHMNRSTYEFIRESCLFSFDGLSRYSKAVLDGKKSALSFPSDSIEVKAVWVQFTPEDIKAKRQKNYYVGQDDKGNVYGLTALHILTKDTPNWFWTTFHHVEEPKNEYEVPDTYGRPKDLDGTIWAYYVLGGTQTDFIKPFGEATILSDYYIEFDFQKSSCMTCHANAHGHPDPERTNDGKLLRNAKGGIVAATEGPLQTIDLGIPNPNLFKKDGKLYFMQTDFLWSIPFRAREEQKPPPDRCKF
jgi:hypothetical protein